MIVTYSAIVVPIRGTSTVLIVIESLFVSGKVAVPPRTAAELAFHTSLPTSTQVPTFTVL